MFLLGANVYPSIASSFMIAGGWFTGFIIKYTHPWA